MKDSGVEWIGQIPKNWTLKRLQYILKERNELNSPIKTKNILSLTVQQGVVPYAQRAGGGNKAKEDLKSMGILEMADSQSEALIKGIIQDLIPEGYKLKTEKQ